MAVIPLMLSLITLLAFLGAGAVAVREGQRRQTLTAMDLVRRSYTTPNARDALSSSEASPMHGFALSKLGGYLLTQRQRERLQSALNRAGRPEVDALTATLRNKVVAALCLGAFGIVIGAFGDGWWWLAVPTFLVAGFWLPDLLVYNIALRRTDEITRELPDAIELLNMCMESGMGFQAALAQVAEAQQGVTAGEFARVLRELQLGQSRQEALVALTERTSQEDLVRIMNAVLQADRLGIAMSGVLAEQASEMRAKRRDRAREVAQKVPVKILMPVIACFLPGIFIIVLGPAAVSLAQLMGALP
jgi:tight adherence protein C